ESEAGETGDACAAGALGVAAVGALILRQPVEASADGGFLLFGDLVAADLVGLGGDFFGGGCRLVVRREHSRHDQRGTDAQSAEGESSKGFTTIAEFQIRDLRFHLRSVALVANER